ncbi:MAG TPA: hypothetical protein VHF87_06540 [Methylomirabilota bacterium]|nr:hypothetical protein [Methylomirabilota bacterium]
MTRRTRAWLAAAGSAAAFAAGFFLRMNAAYGPLNLSAQASDWAVLWELWRHGQIASRVVLEGAALGAAAAAAPWIVFGLLDRRPGPR